MSFHYRHIYYMARSLCQTLIRSSYSQPFLFAAKSPIPRLLTLRCLSSQSENPNLVDSDPDQQREALAVQKIEEAIHRIIARRSAPDWLPFVPGSSYWVPPRKRSYGIAELLEKLANTLTEEEVMSLTTCRGWPSSAFFVSDASSHMEEVERPSENMSLSEDEDD